MPSLSTILPVAGHCHVCPHYGLDAVMAVVMSKTSHLVVEQGSLLKDINGRLEAVSLTLLPFAKRDKFVATILCSISRLSVCVVAWITVQFLGLSGH